MVIATVNQALYSALNVTTLTDVIGTGKVFNVQAPEGTARPYVVYNIASGGPTNETPREGLDVTVTVKCVAVTAASAQTVADIIKGLLHNAEVAAAGWYDFRVQMSGMFMYSETIDSQQIWYAGANYTMRTASTSV